MTKKKPIEPPETPPVEDDLNASIRTEAANGIAAGLALLGYATPRPAVSSADAATILSSAPPYLLSRAETQYVAFCASFDGEVRLPFNTIPPITRAAWLAVAGVP